MADVPPVPPAIEGPSSGSSFELGSSLAHVVRTRLGILALVLGALTLLGTLVPSAWSASEVELPHQRVVVLLAEVGLLLDAGFVYLVWGSRRPDRDVFHWASIYQVARAATLCLSPFPEVGAPLLTWSVVLACLVPLIVPVSAKRATVSIALAALCQPLGLVVFDVLSRTPHPGDWIRSGVVAIFGAGLGWIGADVARSFRGDASRQVGSYNLVELIGHGGMGEVWSAEHRFLARPAAVKLIYGGSESPRVRERVERRFRREAQVTARLTSPHTIQVFDYGISPNDAYYYVMEHLDGFDLQTLVTEYRPLSPGRAVYLMKQICDSIGEAHHAGLIHRDLKPGNLFVVRRGLAGDFVKVLDFGLVGLTDHLKTASFDGQITAHGMMTGTPAYMSPEMVLGHKVDTRADLYSLGCVLFFLVTGQLLYPNRAPLQMALAHAHEPAPDVRAIATQPIPDDFARLVSFLLEKQPENRPQNATQLLRMLGRLSISGSWTALDSDDWWDMNKPTEESESMRVAVRRDGRIEVE